MIRYQVRSKELLDIVNEIKSKRLIISPYFQRNLVWREIHQVDFIKTILLGYPFPQIFIAKGSIDLESMTSTSSVVDGQQRLSAICDYVFDQLKVDGRLFSEQDVAIREAVFKYQIPIIDLDLNNDAPEIREIFQRLNRTFYSLNTIEKLSSEYASSEFMLLAKHLTGEVEYVSDEDEEDEEDVATAVSIDPTTPDEFIEWANKNVVSEYKNLMIESPVFSGYEISRQVHLMYTLNLLATKLHGIYARNEQVKRCLENYKDNVETKDELVENFDNTASFIKALELDDSSYWYNKANIFSLFLYVSNNLDALDISKVDQYKAKLIDFEENIPVDYQAAAKESVNNKNNRLLRNEYINNIMNF